MFDQRGRLDIFENFVVDRALPKHQPVTTAAAIISGINQTFTIMQSASSVVVRSDWNAWNGLKEAPTPLRLARHLWQRLWDWILERRRMPIEEFFRSVKNNVEELEVVDHRLKGYLTAIEQAKRNGQTALVEKLEANVEGVRTEAQLVAIKLRKYLTEEQLVAFVKKAKKGLRLDWLKNFTRVVPSSVIKTKEAADDRKVFDNYVVLHYDPDAKSWAETQEEKERRKDPILFGVMRGRRRLYFVGDWTDEYCDLTLDQLADVLGEAPKLIAPVFVPEDFQGATP